jgi:hypothetical protein
MSELGADGVALGDGRSRPGNAVAAGEVPGDRLRAGIVTGGDQTAPQVDDQLDDRRWRRPR